MGEGKRCSVCLGSCRHVSQEEALRERRGEKAKELSVFRVRRRLKVQGHEYGHGGNMASMQTIKKGRICK
jgi:hypothetical protein